MSDVGLIIGALVLKKILGPAAEDLGEDIRRMYKAGAEKLLAATRRKIKNLDDGKQANLRVTYDVLWNGACTDDEVCAEYFGGVLASCRSEDGKDDSNIQFSSVIRSLSSSQLRLHYFIYNVLNKMFVARKLGVNVALSSEIQEHSVYLSPEELLARHQIKIDTDFNILYRQGLIFEYRTEMVKESTDLFHYSMAKPTTFGVMLYAVAHNRMPEWRRFSSVDFGNFESIQTKLFFGATRDELQKALKGAFI